MRFILLLFTYVMFFGSVDVLYAEPVEEVEAAQSGEMKEGIPVIIDGVELFTIKARVTSFYPRDRARLTTERILELAKDSSIPVDAIQLKISGEEMIEITARDKSISTITIADATAENLPLLTVAEERKNSIREATQNYRDARMAQQLIIQFIKAFLLTGLMIWLFYLIRKGTKLYRGHVTENKLLKHYLMKFPGGRLLPVEPVQKIIDYFGMSIVMILRLILIYFYLTFVLSLFPWTVIYSKRLFNYVNMVFNTFGSVILGFLPNTLSIAAILFVSGLLLKIFRLFFDQLKSEKIKINNFYAEWADTTYKITKFLIIALTAICIYPYIPGSQSAAFQGVSVFLGLLVSLGSSSVVSNAVAGILMTYNRSFQIGDRVKIGEHVGDIIEKSMMSIRMRTTKNEDITIPNTVIINNPVVNYSSSSNTSALILHITVTIGYDVPWQVVNDLLIRAALATPDVLDEPKPFVLQRSLNDFTISHEINAYTNKVNKMAMIYSEMYKNIIDILKAAGIDPNVPHQLIMRGNNVEESDKRL